MNIYEYFARNVRRSPDSPAIKRLDEPDISFKGLDDEVRRVAAWLDSLGIGEDDNVAVYMDDCPAFIPAVLGTFRVGAILTPVNVMLGVDEIDDILGDVSPDAIITSETFANNASAVAERSDSLTEDAIATTSGWGFDFDFEPSESPPPVTRLDDETAVIMHTSGTTGRPKGVVQTHRNIVAQVDAGVSMSDTSPEDTVLIAVPLFHVGGLNAGLLATLLVGGSVAIQPWWNPESWAKWVEATEATLTGLIPTMIIDVVNSEEARSYDTSSLRLCTYGGGATPQSVIDEFKADFGVGSVSDFYGLTEVSGVCITYAAEEDRIPGSMGRLTPCVEARIVDVESREEVETGERGELLLRGDSVASFVHEEHSEDAFEDGWLRTGDVVYQDDEGYFYYVERFDDIIMTGGEKVAPTTVENVLQELEGVDSVAVFGTPHDRFGEAVTAAIVRNDESLTADDVKQFADERDDLAGYKKPRRIHFVDSFPRTGSGKVDKVALSDNVAEDE